MAIFKHHINIVKNDTVKTIIDSFLFEVDKNPATKPFGEPMPIVDHAHSWSPGHHNKFLKPINWIGFDKTNLVWPSLKPIYSVWSSLNISPNHSSELNSKHIKFLLSSDSY